MSKRSFQKAKNITASSTFPAGVGSSKSRPIEIDIDIEKIVVSASSELF